MSLALGDWVSVRGHEGQVRYFGATGFSEGMWAGIELQAAVGRNDGAVRGVRYFSCAPRHGLFVPASQCVKIDGPSDSGSGAPDLADAWVKVEGADEGAALKAGQESQKVIDYLTAQYPHGATPDKAPALKKERSSGGFFGGRSSSRARVKNQLSQGALSAALWLSTPCDTLPRRPHLLHARFPLTLHPLPSRSPLPATLFARTGRELRDPPLARDMGRYGEI
mmetsp:Transcript_30890/g.92297  ORF Transcript_30890/g.92297 Transcript_30890/m.92297 type:complete len:223 (-) Transcript_30890:126-794(-)